LYFRIGRGLKSLFSRGVVCKVLGKKDLTSSVNARSFPFELLPGRADWRDKDVLALVPNLLKTADPSTSLRFGRDDVLLDKSSRRGRDDALFG
jgi:hypothetical protein